MADEDLRPDQGSGEEENDILVHIELMDSYTFRGVINSMRNLCTELIFRFAVKGFFIQQEGSNGSFFTAEFPAIGLSKYSMEACDDKGPVDHIDLKVDASEAYKVFKNVGKNDYVNIYVFASSDSLTVEITKSKNRSNEEPKYLLLPTLTSPIVWLDKPTYLKPEMVKTSSTSMSQTFAQILARKCRTVVFDCYKSQYIICEGLVEGGKVGAHSQWGDVVSSIPSANKTRIIKGGSGVKIKVNENKVFKFPFQVVKSLNRINNLAPNSLVFVTYERIGNTICFSSPVGTYGNFSMYVTSQSDK